MKPGLRVAVFAGLTWVGLHPSVGYAQTIQGRVVERGSEEGIPSTLVRLVSDAGEDHSITAADSSGFYELRAPQPGTFRIVAERIGFDDFETPLLSVENPDGVYPVDLLMDRSPVPIRGLEVTAEQVDQRLKSMTGIDPTSMRWRPLTRQDLIGHAERAHDLTSLMRWRSFAAIEVIVYDDGPCYLMRRYRLCLPVYLNGFRLSADLYDIVPLDMLQAAVVISPTESTIYPEGGVLLFTDGWIR